MAQHTHFGATFFLQALPARGLSLGARDLLVVGCGDGVEVEYLREHISRVTAIDVELRAELADDERTRYMECSVEEIPLHDCSFDYAFCYHVLEHVSMPNTAIAEIHRVLRPGGVLFIGVPNRNRVVGYIGSRNESLRCKLQYNFADAVAKASGRFRNECGAHAGFSQVELSGILQPPFRRIDWVTGEYLQAKYPALHRISRWRPLLAVSPAIYALAWR